MKGFVLIELLIALAILSVIFFYLTPIGVNMFTPQSNKDVEKLNMLVKKAYEKSKDTGMPQMIWGLKGSNNIHFNKKLFYLSKDVFDVSVNAVYQQGDKYYFLVYPTGIMDKVAITLFGNKKVVSSPLLLRFGVE